MSSTPEELIRKYLDHTCTPEERTIVESWYNATAASAEDPGHPDYAELENNIWKELRKASQPAKRLNWLLITTAAACLAICLFFYHSNEQGNIQKPVSISRIMPGTNQAELLLSDGTVIPLSDAKSGLTTAKNGAMVAQLGGGKLTFNGTNAISSGPEVNYNTLRTPRGGQYQIELPDGTRAWLNAASSLKFPSIFGANERTVEIVGEVYFEVAVNKHKPFKVISQGQTVEVLGTHFNVSSYPNETFIKTTLMEGSVKVVTENNVIFIKPGEQTLFNIESQQITVQKTDLEEAIAWKKGYFQFTNEDIKSIMRKLSRWYNIEIDYSKNFVDQRFTGSVSRFDEAAKVLKMLEYTGSIHFKIEGRRVTVMP
ncbi:FecR family protein [Pedobacter sp. WC2501]|uniref:FecR family protein n=1 Tax=Pedobacter sp. WC2501 TaxID=3461400 RepID=UPI004045EE5F